MKPGVLLSLVVTLGGLGCRAITADEIRQERQPALIRYHGDPGLLEAPREVSRGANFEVAVRTFGGGCIAQGDTEVSVSGRSAEVRPYDLFVRYLPENMACTDDLRLYVHRATLRFTDPGLAVVRARGRERPGDHVVVIERTVVVR